MSEEKHIKFLGYEFKMIPGNSKKGYITQTIPDRDRLQQKVDSIAESIKKIPRNYSREQFIGEINHINSQVERNHSILSMLYVGESRHAQILPQITVSC